MIQQNLMQQTIHISRLTGRVRKSRMILLGTYKNGLLCKELIFTICHLRRPKKQLFLQFLSYRFAKHETLSFPIPKTDTKILRINRF